MIGFAYFDGELDVYSIVNLSPAQYLGRGMYGTYTVDVHRGGTFVYSGLANGGTGAFLGTPTLKFAAATTGWSVTAAQPSVWNGGITLNPANLDAVVGAAGFGGRAWDLTTGGILVQ